MRIGIHQSPGVLRVLLPMTPRHVVAFERGWTGAHRGGFFVPPLWAPDQPRPPMKPRHIPKGCGRLNDDEEPQPSGNVTRWLGKGNPKSSGNVFVYGGLWGFQFGKWTAVLLYRIFPI